MSNHTFTWCGTCVETITVLSDYQRATFTHTTLRTECIPCMLKRHDITERLGSTCQSN